MAIFAAKASESQPGKVTVSVRDDAGRICVMVVDIATASKWTELIGRAVIAAGEHFKKSEAQP